MSRILLGHGSGGRMMHELISEHFAPAFGNAGTADAAVLDMQRINKSNAGRIAISTDSYVVSPLFFPGGDIGEMAVYGTVNDLSMCGAEPLYITAGFIIEEGLDFDELKRIVASMAAAAKRANVKIVAGDTKVVDRGKGDGIFINTAGFGIVPDGLELSPDRMQEGDALILSGSLANHGVAVMAKRNGLFFDPPVLSDTAPMNAMVADMLKAAKGGIRVMRDPTRGGLATTLKEFALQSNMCMAIKEDLIPVDAGVKGACDMLGLDPLHVANEGILVAAVDADMAKYVLEAARSHDIGSGCTCVGHVALEPAAGVLLETSIGGSRLVDMLEGEMLPRIC